jgi:NitT/TauT family transport system substrate-binding protein
MFKHLICLTAILFATHSTLAGPIELALNWKAEPEFGGFYQAIDVLKKQGIEFKVFEGGSGTPTIQMLGAQKIPLAIVSADELVTARDRGLDLVALFAVYQSNPQGIMMREESPWKTAEQLFAAPDATIGVQMGLPFVAYLKKKYPTMKAKLVPYQGGIGLFLAKKDYAQQCFITAEPLAAEKAGVKTRSFTFAELGFNPYLAVVATHREVLNKQRAQLSLVMKGIRQGWEDYLKNPTETDKLMNKINPSMSLDTFTQSGKAQIKLVKPNPEFVVGSMTKERWQTLSQQLLELGLIKKVQKPENYIGDLVY